MIYRFIIFLLASVFIFSSCNDCYKTECADIPSLYIDLLDANTGESLLFGDNSTLNISNVNTFSTTEGEVENYPKLGFNNASISPDSFLLIRLENLMSNRVLISTDSLVTDTIDLFTRLLPESTCCDETLVIDSFSVNGIVLNLNDVPLLFFR